MLQSKLPYTKLYSQANASPVWYAHSDKDIIISTRNDAVSYCSLVYVGGRWNSLNYSWNKSSDACLQELNWLPFHARRIYFSVNLTHDILHNRAIFFNIFHFLPRPPNDIVYPIVKNKSLSLFFINTPRTSFLPISLIISVCA